MNKNKLLWILPSCIVVLASLFASESPDTLETMAIKYGFASRSQEINTIFAGYSVPFISNEFLTILAAGLIGLLLIYVLYKILFITVRKFNR